MSTYRNYLKDYLKDYLADKKLKWIWNYPEQKQNTFFHNLNIGIPNIEKDEDVLNVRLVETLEGFEGVEGLLKPISSSSLCNLTISFKLTNLLVGGYLNEVVTIIKGKINFSLPNDLEKVSPEIVKYIHFGDIPKLVELAPGLQPLEKLLDQKKLKEDKLIKDILALTYNTKDVYHSNILYKAWQESEAKANQECLY